jgi:hypothetical protein
MNDIISAFSHTLQSGLFLDEILHGLVAAPFAGLLYYKTKDWKFSLIPILVTYLIDMDHWVDYLLYYGGDISLRNFVAGEYFEKTNRAVVPLHAWEWLFFVGAIAIERGKWKSILTAISLGVLAHLLWDTHTIGSVAFYSILYRISNNFVIIV